MLVQFTLHSEGVSKAQALGTADPMQTVLFIGRCERPRKDGNNFIEIEIYHRNSNWDKFARSEFSFAATVTITLPSVIGCSDTLNQNIMAARKLCRNQ